MFKNKKEYDKNNNLIYHKNFSDYEYFYKYDKEGCRFKITEQEFNKIKEDKNKEINRLNIIDKSYRFEIMDI